MTSNIPPPPDNIDLEGQVWKLENLNQTLENAQIHVNVLGSSQEFNTTSDENGYFRIDNVPLGKDILFSVGGISERYSFTNVEYTTPSEIVNLSDSVNSNFGAVLPLKLSTSSADHIHDQTLNGTQQDTIWFYLGNSYTINQKNTIRNYFTNFQADENNAYIFEESFTELNNIGINIEYGTYNTQAYSTEITTPLGNTLHPVIYANTTMGVGNYITFVHEIKRALAIGEVAWYSVMKATAPDYTQEDKDIAKDVLRPYWNKAVYQEEKTWIDLIKISEDMNSKSPNSNSSTTKVDTYEPSSSQDDIKFNYINK
ncbi:MAG: carboxypeptidase-like regulatory domain-containing protein [Bacteroidales bacterium]|nr:carboxypeptidase-like regulatory domain-containing protein [Bacteroidales bacterium]